MQIMNEKLISPFFNEVHERFTINELAKKTGVSYSYVYRQVEKAKKEKILEVNERSRRNYCKPNYNNPKTKTYFVKISGHYADAFFKENNELSLIMDRILSRLPAKTDFNLLSIVLFGSRAKETGTPRSDIDLLVLVSSKDLYDDIIQTECAAISRSFGVEINPLIAEPVNLLNMLKDKEENVAKEILKHKVILFGAEKFWEIVFEGLK